MMGFVRGPARIRLSELREALRLKSYIPSGKSILSPSIE
jgi:hypothetical protein